MSGVSDARARVLLVDDSALVLDALRILLEETGHAVSTASTVRQAIDLALAERPDVILLDLTLRDESGLAVLEALARAERSPAVAVAVTGHDAPEVRERCLRAGCREVLVKPIAAMALPGQIARWLEEASGI